MPLTFLSSAPAAASFAVAPVLTSKRPALSLSLRSPVGQPASPGGQPIPWIQRAATRSVSLGSKVNGSTWLNSRADAPNAANAARSADQANAFMKAPAPGEVCRPFDKPRQGNQRAGPATRRTDGTTNGADRPGVPQPDSARAGAVFTAGPGACAPSPLRPASRPRAGG